MVGGCARRRLDPGSGGFPFNPALRTWSKADASPDDLARDRYACMQQSRVPYGTSGGSVSGWVSRAGEAQGGTDGGFQMFGAQRDAQRQADQLFDACMQSRGWSK